MLLVLIGVLLFAVGLLVGQQTQRLKYAKYLRPGTVSSMDLAMLRANLELLRSYMPGDIPRVYYKSACGCFMARSVVTSDQMKKPLDEARAFLMVKAILTHSALESEFPELPVWDPTKPGTSPDHDFKMTFVEVNIQNPDASGDIAEYVDGKIVFK
jgi:hypothetical protein